MVVRIKKVDRFTTDYAYGEATLFQKLSGAGTTTRFVNSVVSRSSVFEKKKYNFSIVNRLLLTFKNELSAIRNKKIKTRKPMKTKKKYYQLFDGVSFEIRSRVPVRKIIPLRAAQFDKNLPSAVDFIDYAHNVSKLLMQQHKVVEQAQPTDDTLKKEITASGDVQKKNKKRIFTTKVKKSSSEIIEENIRAAKMQDDATANTTATAHAIVQHEQDFDDSAVEFGTLLDFSNDTPADVQTFSLETHTKKNKRTLGIVKYSKMDPFDTLHGVSSLKSGLSKKSSKNLMRRSGINKKTK